MVGGNCRLVSLGDFNVVGELEEVVFCWGYIWEEKYILISSKMKFVVYLKVV